MIIDGKAIADRLVAELKPRMAALPEKRFFGAAVIGDDASSLYFLKQKEKVAQALGIEFRLYRLPVGITTDELRQEIGRLAGVKTCGGFIVQLPLPEHLTNRRYVLNAIPKEKDVDVLSEAGLEDFCNEQGPILPPAVATVEELLRTRWPHDLSAARVAVLGAGALIGKPVALWLRNRCAKLMVFDSKSTDLYERLPEANILISGTGRPGLFSAKHLSENTLVIDFGYGRTAYGKVAGDFDSAEAEAKNITYTKTPGGTGPVLVVKLFENFWKLAQVS